MPYLRMNRNLLAHGFLIFALCIGVAGCKSGETYSCPAGDVLKGEPPPNGQEVWCEKTIGGQPVKDGLFIFWTDSGGKMIEGQYKDGKQDGEWKTYYETGEKKSIDHYRDGVQQGEHIGWYINGQISAKGQYKDGQPDGVWKRWGPDGIRNWEEVYKDGKKVS